MDLGERADNAWLRQMLTEYEPFRAIGFTRLWQARAYLAGRAIGTADRQHLIWESVLLTVKQQMEWRNAVTAALGWWRTQQRHGKGKD